MANVHGLGSIKKDKDAAGDDDDEEDGQNFYVGGASQGGGGSGLSVIDPNDAKKNAVDGIFGQAQAQMGGGGAMPPPPPADGQKRTITVYRNGFTVDDGPLREHTDPANQAFLKDMAEGMVPRELEEGATGSVAVDLVDKRGEEYEAKPAPAYVAYSGEGQTMGAAKVDDAAVAGGGDTGAAGGAAAGPPVVDEAAPKTTLQIRLHDGRRVKATLNLAHTVRDLQALIAAEGAGGAPYVLMAGFPPAQLTDFGATIEAAGLKGAAVTQKLA